MSVPQNSPSRDVLVVRQVALAATFTALVFLSTSLFYVALIASSGFFNLGEAFVFLAALIGGPIVGAIAGGLGSAMADAFLGYGSFVPATLILKGLEGFVAGLIYKYGKEVRVLIQYENEVRFEILLRRIVLIIVTIFIFLFSVYLGIQFDFVFGSIDIVIPGLILVIVTLGLSLVIWWIEFRLGDKGEMALACILAGPIIVVGYFLFEIGFLSVAPEAALLEVPFNIAQVVFGTLIAVPIVTYLKELGILPDPATP